MDIKKYLKDNILIFDGAMGTMLQNRGLKRGALPEVLNIEETSNIIEIHKKYIEAGAKVITTNTFGANGLKLKNCSYSLEEIIKAAVENAKEAIGSAEVLTALDVGPLGQLLEPMGTLKFEEAYEYFKTVMTLGEKYGADLILIETMTDLGETRAAVLAAKENTKLPVFCTMSFESTGRTFAGCDPLSMTLTLQGLGVDALGINCSLGPIELRPIVEEVLKYSKIPVMVQPNAGLPKVVNGETVFDISKEIFAKEVKGFCEKGVRIVGGCCGTDESFIKELSQKLKDLKPVISVVEPISAICSYSKAVIIDGVRVIGERINPTGKKLFKEALKNENLDYILREAISQIEAGADILDVNVGLPEINEEEMIIKVIKEVQSISPIPLQVDSTDPKVVEAALRVYNGKAILNSVNGEDKILDSLLPLVKKYGAAVVGLTLDERGLPTSKEERIEIAEKIIKRAEEYGISKEDIYIDCLTLTASTSQDQTFETLKAITYLREQIGVNTVLGVSNISFGLPRRDLINRTFLTMAMTAGLTLPIINPLDKDMMDSVKAFKVLSGEDIGSNNYIADFSGEKAKALGNVTERMTLGLYDIIVKGIKEEAAKATEELLKEKKETEVINEYIVPALDYVGDKFAKGEVFLPQLIQSAETVKKAFDVIKAKLAGSSSESISKGKIVLATVKGDIHDIGKNIVKAMLENYGYDVIDLGKDVSKEKVLEAVEKHDVQLVGLSALMTTTVRSMEETIALLREKGHNCKFMVGGAVLNKEYAEMIKADFYARDAKESVEIARMVLGE
ncbi:homocysteine S-methyltransferase family protein [Clostridium polyendosporum]|uniref:homocysteine S-methyltransferase family protein n=1 Tax=Clostridium polyendosporum TaxID=69208 RepID=UPI001BB4120C|nr:homocysteine S-methyltransferase family protein [Clostridium polyendosporum]